MSKQNDERRKGFKGKPRRKPNNRKPVEKPDKNEEYVESGTNDPSWYGLSPELLRDAASIPFSNAAGVAFSLGVASTSGQSPITDQPLTIPGLYTLDIVPCPFAEPYANDPLNIAANSMLAYVVHANSRNLSYNASDLMIYNIAMGNVYSYINFLMRVYGLAQVFSTFNRNLPNLVEAAQYVNYSDVINHLADFRYGINMLINKAASFAAPADMPYFRRLAFLFSGIYSEGESIKDQLYMYVPAGFMQYNETAEETGGSLQYVDFRSTTHTVDQLIAYGNSLLNAIIGSEDMNIISGDILKAYGQEGLLKLATMPEVYNVLPVTDLAVLEQFQNAVNLNVNNSQFTCSLTQSNRKTTTFALTGGVMLKGTQGTLDAMTNNFLLNTILTNPEAPDVMERTRLQCIVDSIDAETGSFVYYATEVAVGAHMWIATGATPTNAVVPAYRDVAQTPDQTTMVTMIREHCRMETFKFHPKVFYFVQNATGKQFLNFAMDTDNYAVFDKAVLSRMNEAAIMSLFHTHTINIVR